MKEANFTMPNALAPMVSNATAISKSGSVVTIESSKQATYAVGDNTIRVDKTVRFSVEVGKATAAVTGISGLSAKKGWVWPGINEVRYTSTGQNNGILEIKSWIAKKLSCTSDGCK
jgi:outer membrane receptor protein involved in Fe transport